MKEHIKKLEQELTALKEAYEKQERKDYEKQVHKVFKARDWVKKGNQFGRIGWVKNKSLNIAEDMGYCGIDLRSGNGGFLTCKRDEWELIKGKELLYFTEKRKLKLTLTGEEIQSLMLSYRYVNKNETHDKFMNLLEKTAK